MQRVGSIVGLAGLLGLVAGCGPGGAASEGGSSPACGDGVIDAGELCDDGNLTPGDGCSPECLPSGMPYDCFDLLEGDFPGQSTAVGELLALADGSFLAAGSLDHDPSDRGWIGRYGPAGDQLWLVDTISIDPEIRLVRDMVGDGGSGVWALAHRGSLGRVLVHFEQDGSAGSPIAIETQAGAAIQVKSLERTDAGIWLAGDLEVDAWLGLYDPASDTVTELLHEDYLGFRDHIYAIAQSEDEVMVAATMSATPNNDGDSPLVATTDILMIAFDHSGNELRRTLLDPNADPEFVRFADSLVVDPSSGRWYVGGRYVPKYSTIDPAQVWFAPAEAQAAWQWVHEARLGDFVSGYGGFIAATTQSGTTQLLGRVTNLGEDGTVRWSFDRLDGDDVPNYENFSQQALAKDPVGQLRTAGIVYGADSSRLRSCLVAE